MKVSVLLATFKRDGVLAQTLDGYLKLVSSSSDFEVLVVDNAVLPSTKTLVASYLAQGLNIRYIECAKPGKNASLNKGLDYLSGELIVLTDDDAIPSPNFICNFIDAAEKHVKVDVFGGAILPFGPNLPSWVDVTNSYMQGAYVIRPKTTKDKKIRPTYIWGPNMAVRKSIFDSGLKFNEGIGPNGNNYVMGSETEFLNRLEKAGYKAMFLHLPYVLHQIRAEQCSIKWLMGRAERQGKGLAYHKQSNGLVPSLHEARKKLSKNKIEQIKEVFKGLLTINATRIISALYVLKLKRSEFNSLSND